MFIASPDLTALRQGDIVRGFYYPILKNSDLDLLGKPATIEYPPAKEIVLHASVINNKHVQCLLKLLPSLTIVVSQCCDVEGRDGAIEAPSFVLAPIDDVKIFVKSGKTPAQIEKFMANDLSEYSNYFYLVDCPDILGAGFVNFNRVFSVHRDDYSAALRGKVLQMTDEARILFKLKLAKHFGRPTDEELEKGIYPT